MKIPYRVGDSFALPVGDGSCIGGTILECEHHVVRIDAGGLVLRVYDAALILQRWRKGEAPRLALAQERRTRDVLSPAKAERLLAASLGVQIFDDAAVNVRKVRNEVSTREISAWPSPATLMWNAPLDNQALDRVLAWIDAHPSAGIRLHGAAAKQAPMLAASRLSRLTIAGPVDGDWGGIYPHVTALTLDARCPVHFLAKAFPNVTRVRIGDGAKHVDLRDIAPLMHLVVLDISHVGIETIEALESMRDLRALRVSHVHGLRSLGPLAQLNLQTLAVEHQPQLESLKDLRACKSLEQLELLGMWQVSIEDCGWLFELPVLKRVEADIGGRRKNVELYRHARWAYPWPSFSDVRVT